MSKTIFVDFDGTLTSVDTCDEMMRQYGKEGWREINKLWEDKTLSTQECAKKLFAMLEATPGDIKKMLSKVGFDQYFKDFTCLCRQKGYDIYILSDGYDFNIKTVLELQGLDIPFFSNKMLYDPVKGFDIDSPFINLQCGKCGTCKCSLIKKLTKPGHEIIYIGDNVSDFCPASLADRVFAKNILYRYCTENGIKAAIFCSFKEIIPLIEGK